MLSSLILALGLSTSPVEASQVEVAVTPLNSIEQTARSIGKTRIALKSDISARSFGKTRIDLKSNLASRSFGKTRI